MTGQLAGTGEPAAAGEPAVTGERLAGGRNNGAVRVGDTVRRRAGGQTPAVQAFLTHLAAVGFTGAPRPLGIDGDGREVLTHLDGVTVGDTRPWPAWAVGEPALVAVGHWLRDLHAAARSFVPPPDPRWFPGHDRPGPGAVVGHHDAAPYNAVWRPAAGDPDPAAGELVGFVDWDLAGPADPLRDLAFVALSWVPLGARDVDAGLGFPAGLDRPRRLRLLLDAYGWSGPVARVLDAVAERAADHAAGLRAAAAAGYGPAADLVAEGVADDFDRAVDGLAADRAALLRA